MPGPLLARSCSPRRVVAGGPGAVVFGYLRWMPSSRRYTSPFVTRCTSRPVSFRRRTALLRDPRRGRAPTSGRAACSWCSISGVRARAPGQFSPPIRRSTSPRTRRARAGRARLIVPGGEQAKNDAAHVGRLLEAIHAAAPVPPLLCRRGRRRRGAGRRRVCRRDGAPRRPADPRADHGARAGRLRRRREERRQRVRHRRTTSARSRRRSR